MENEGYIQNDELDELVHGEDYCEICQITKIEMAWIPCHKNGKKIGGVQVL